MNKLSPPCLQVLRGPGAGGQALPEQQGRAPGLQRVPLVTGQPRSATLTIVDDVYLSLDIVYQCCGCGVPYLAAPGLPITAASATNQKVSPIS